MNIRMSNSSLPIGGSGPGPCLLTASTLEGDEVINKLNDYWQ